jgi:hypothetical protein
MVQGETRIQRLPLFRLYRLVVYLSYAYVDQHSIFIQRALPPMLLLAGLTSPTNTGRTSRLSLFLNSRDSFPKAVSSTVQLLGRLTSTLPHGLRAPQEYLGLRLTMSLHWEKRWD